MGGKSVWGEIIGVTALAIGFYYVFRDGSTTSAIVNSGGSAFSSIVGALQGRNSGSGVTISGIPGIG